MSRLTTPTARVTTITLLLAAATVLAGGLTWPAALTHPLQIPWWVLVAVFAVTEAFVLRFRVRGQNQGISLSEIPLVLGLFFAEPRELLIGRVVGSALIFVLYHRHTALKAMFNTAMVGSGTAVALVTFHGLAGNGTALSLRGYAATVAAVALAGFVDGAMLATVVSWYDGGRPAREVVIELLMSAGVPALTSIGGIVAVLALADGATAWPLALTGVAAILGYRAFAALADRHASMERLYVLSDALAVAPGSADVLTSVLTQSVDLMRAEYAEVVLRDGGPRRSQRPEETDPPGQPMDAGRPDTVSWSLRHGAAMQGPLPVPAGILLDFPPTTARVITGDTAAERAFLAARELSEALIVPLRLDRDVAGQLLIGDRRGEEHGFNSADGKLLETVANHGSVALRNGRLMERLHHEAHHDELTGLPNRLYFRDLVETAADNAAAGTAPCTVMGLDFNGFKAVNDSLGHAAGDELLRVLARRLEVAAGDDAVVARLGGDEFAVLSTSCAQPASATELANRLIAVFEDPVAVAGTRLRLGCSLGIAIGPRDGQTAGDLLKHADSAMYAAKAGAGGVRMFSKDLVDDSPNSLTLASDLRDAVGRHEISVELDPMVRLTDGVVHSVEVLPRWSHPQLGEIPPKDFFLAAERSGQLAALSQVVLDRALELCRQWQLAGHPVRVAVNLAAKWLADPSLPDQVRQALERNGVPPHLLCLEISESSVIGGPKGAMVTLSRLRYMGVHLSLDDFGTGYSSLTYLSRLPIDQMKMDQSFVQRLNASSRDLALAQSIVNLGGSLGMEIVGEGVTDAQTHRALRDLGCDLGQGSLFSQPLGPQALELLLQRRGVVGGALPPAGLPTLPEERPLAGQVLDRAGGGLPTQGDRHSLERQVRDRQTLDHQAQDESVPERGVPDRRSPGRWVPDRRDPSSGSQIPALRPAGRAERVDDEGYPFGRAHADHRP